MHPLLGATVDVGTATAVTTVCTPCLESLGASPAVAPLAAVVAYAALRLVLDEVKAWRAKHSGDPGAK